MYFFVKYCSPSLGCLVMVELLLQCILEGMPLSHNLGRKLWLLCLMHLFCFFCATELLLFPLKLRNLEKCLSYTYQGRPCWKNQYLRIPNPLGRFSLSLSLQFLLACYFICCTFQSKSDQYLWIADCWRSKGSIWRGDDVVTTQEFYPGCYMAFSNHFLNVLVSWKCVLRWIQFPEKTGVISNISFL